MKREVCIPEHHVVAKVSRLAETRNYNHKLLNIPEAWKNSKGKGVTVGVLDTGKPEHIDLEVNKSWSAIKNYLVDKNGHGTHVAGLLAARENGRGVLGIAPEVTLNTYTVLDEQGVGGAYALAEGILKAVEDGCDVINMSLGISSEFDVSILQTACEEAAGAGCIIVAAAGNANGKIDQPARYPYVISVGAVTVDKHRATFSNYGPELDFVVGGVDLYSTWLGDGYAKLSGTSMACPIFAGLCALIKGDHMGRKVVGTPVDNVHQMIEHVKRFSFDIGHDGFDAEHGFGLPIFQAPLIPTELDGKEVILKELDSAIDSLEAVRAAVEEM